MSRRKGAAPKDDEIATLWPGSSLELLKALHILTPDGRLNQDSRRKLKQVLHLVQLLKPTLDRLLTEEDDPFVADLGAGKSYLGLILYDLILNPAGRGRLAAIEIRPDLAATAQKIATGAGFTRAVFTAAPINDPAAGAALHGARPALVTALHACDTATDDAIRFALRHDAKAVALIPCCQAEAAQSLDGLKGPLDALWRHPIQRRAFGAHITNTVRALLLESHGYKVRVTEFTGFEHTQKNELILAERVQKSNAQARTQLARLLEQVPVKLGVLDLA
ncbi:MAG: SAM-dependent methyltransferase [Micropepsaceae bacterium]